MANTQTRIVIVLLAVLFAVMAVSAVVLLVLPGSQNRGTTTVDDAAPSTRNSLGVGADTGPIFNLSVLQKAGYIFLDKRLLNEKALPVQPPVAVGKANPFL